MSSGPEAESTSDGIPASEYPVTARAPGKCILFGEHAVVHGRPELVFAIDLETQITARRAERWTLDGSAPASGGNPYLDRAIADRAPPGPPLELTTVSRLPRAAGLGSSAAFLAALLAAFAAGSGGCERAELADRAFRAEQGAQGVGSPGDTAAAVGGGLLAINGGRGPIRWESSDGPRRWTVRAVPDPGWSWLVAYSGVPRSTGATVRSVGRRLAEPDGPRLL
ncbi:MAG: mevalonate kinase family protein, partial [Thermoplasmata archaeon]